MHDLKRDKSLEKTILAVDLLRTLGQSEKALALIDRVRAEHPSNLAIEFALGQIYFSRFREAHHPADLTDSINHLRIARSLGPKNYKTLFFLSLICTHAGLLPEARECCEAILEGLPNDPKARALRLQIEQAMEAQHRREASHSEGSPGARPGSSSAEKKAESTPADAFLGRLCEADEVVAAFAFDDKGKLLASRSRESATFTLNDQVDVVWKMISGSRADASHIGVGRMQSCLLSGDDWQVAIRVGDAFHVVVFLEGHVVPELLQELSAEPAGSVD